ncbi:WD40-repeat-containing domain protein, partial [Rhizoctonia solani]
NSDVPDMETKIDANISGQLAYSCIYWVSHLLAAAERAQVDLVMSFINKPRLLYWLEVLSLLQRVDVALHGLRELSQWLKVSIVDWTTNINQPVWDACRFVFAFFDPIATGAPHIYVSALAFLPKRSDIPSSLATLAMSLHSSTILTHPGILIVYRSMANKPLLGHTDLVTSIAFSPDGTRTVSGSLDRTIRVCDINTGTAITSPMTAHIETINSVAFSPDGTRLASGFDDHTIRVWD